MNDILVQFNKKNLLGQGSYGSVYKCKLNEIDVAIKKYNGKLTMKWNQTVMRELICMCSLQKHPHIIELLKCHVDSIGKCYLIFPLYKSSLHTFLKHNPNVHVTTLLKWTKQLLSALKHLHLSGFIHRDIKLENILITEKNDLILCDLGMARFVSSNEISRMTGNVCSIWTRPPEMQNNNNYLMMYDSRIDSWSLGCTLLALCNGEYVFKDDQIKCNFKSIQLKCKSSKERQLILRNLIKRNDLPDEFIVLLSKLLCFEMNKREYIKNISFLNEASEIILKKYHLEIPPVLFKEHTYKFIEKSDYEKINIGLWLHDISQQLVIDLKTLLNCYINWIKFGDSTPLSAIASLSLSCKFQETKYIQLSIFSKAVGKKVKDIIDAEDFIMKQSHGCIASNEIIHIKKYLFVFCFLVCNYTITEANDFICCSEKNKSEIWKKICLSIPKLAEKCYIE